MWECVAFIFPLWKALFPRADSRRIPASSVWLSYSKLCPFSDFWEFVHFHISMESAICSREFLKEFSSGNSMNIFIFCFYSYPAWDAHRSKKAAAPFTHFSFLVVHESSGRLVLIDAGRMQSLLCFAARGWKRQSAPEGGGQPSCFESCCAEGAGGKVQSSPFGKGRLGSAPAPHALSIFSFIQRQTALLPLPLLVCDTSLEAAFPRRWGSGGHDPRRPGTQDAAAPTTYSAFRGKVKDCSKVAVLFLPSCQIYIIFPPSQELRFKIVLLQGSLLYTALDSYSTVQVLHQLLKSSDYCVSHSLSEGATGTPDNGD